MWAIHASLQRVCGQQPQKTRLRCQVSARMRDHAARGSVMNWDRIEGNWKQLTGKVKEKWGKLTEDDLPVINGKQDKLAGRIQERYGIAKDEAERQVNTWANRM